MIVGLVNSIPESLMSYIHQALKKAQSERDRRFGPYKGVLESARLQNSRRAIRWVLIGLPAVGMLFLAFIFYSWLDPSAPQTTPAKLAHPAQAETARPATDKAGSAEALCQTGKQHHLNGNLAEAKLCYEKALQADPGCATALNNLGVILMAGQNYQDARKSFEKAIRLKPEYVDPWYNMACLFALTKEPEKALRYLKRAAALDPQVNMWAMEDADLEYLRSQPGFAQIITP